MILPNKLQKEIIKILRNPNVCDIQIKCFDVTGKEL